MKIANVFSPITGYAPCRLRITFWIASSHIADIVKVLKFCVKNIFVGLGLDKLGLDRLILICVKSSFARVSCALMVRDPLRKRLAVSL